MRLLAIDTALGCCSAGIYDTDIGMIAALSPAMARGHAELLMPLIERLMQTARAHFNDIDRIAVTVGPGSFTGLRVGVAAARGLALASKKPVVGVTTLAAFAAPYRAAAEALPVLAVVDARHAQVYMQLFEANGRVSAPARLARLQEVVLTVSQTPHRIVGTAAQVVADALPVMNAKVEPRIAPDIEWVARLGASTEPGDAPAPFYLQAPDARPQDAGRLPRR